MMDKKIEMRVPMSIFTVCGLINYSDGQIYVNEEFTLFSDFVLTVSFFEASDISEGAVVDY